MSEDFENRVRARAHAIWMEDGCPDGRADEHWIRAVEAINAEIAAAALPAPVSVEPTAVEAAPVLAPVAPVDAPAAKPASRKRAKKAAAKLATEAPAEAAPVAKRKRAPRKNSSPT